MECGSTNNDANFTLYVAIVKRKAAILKYGYSYLGVNMQDNVT